MWPSPSPCFTRPLTGDSSSSPPSCFTQPLVGTPSLPRLRLLHAAPPPTPPRPSSSPAPAPPQGLSSAGAELCPPPLLLLLPAAANLDGGVEANLGGDGMLRRPDRRDSALSRSWQEERRFRQGLPWMKQQIQHLSSCSIYEAGKVRF
nr:unnamed protein product [Digitaria exilis]